MNLRTKTFAIITGTFVIAFTVLAMLLSNFIVSGYNRIEVQDTQDKVSQMQSAINNSFSNLETMITNWAERDDTYQYIQNKNTEYVKSNLVDITFFNNRLNFIGFFDTSGNAVYVEAYDLINGKPTTIPEGLEAYLKPGSPLLCHSDSDSGAKVIMSLPEAPMMVVSHPILTSQGGGPYHGTLIFGRYLDSVELARISEMAHLSIKAYQPSDSQMPSDFSTVLPELLQGTSIVVRPLNDNVSAGYTLLKDINGKPALVIRVDNPQLFYAQSHNIVFYFTLSLLVFGLLLIIVTLLLLGKLVISPISNLSQKVNVIGQKGSLSSRITVRGKDELSQLAMNINGMLDNLEQSRKLQKESEAFNSVLLEGSPNPIEAINPDGSIRFVNSALERITGYSKSQLIGRKPPFPWWLDNTQQYYSDLQESMSCTFCRRERHFRRENGKSFWVDITSTVIEENGKFRFFIANWVDISERKRAVSALQESEKRFRELAELLPELVFETDLNGKLTFVNRIAFSAFGYPIQNNSSLYFSDFIAPLDREIVEQNCNRIITGEDLSDIQCMAIRKNSRVFPSLIHMTPIKNNLGEAIGLRGILVDITKQKEIETELRNSEEFSTSLRENSPYPIVVFNTDNSIRYVNPALEKLTGYSAKELIGQKPPFPYWPSELRDQLMETLSLAMQSNQKVEKLLRKKNGDSFWVELNSLPIKEGGKTKYMLSTWVDITAQKLANEELQKLYQLEKRVREALQVEISSRAEFTRALVHELKTPLTPIIASSELLTEELKEEPLIKLAQNVHRGALNMNQRVDELLDLARGEVGILKVNLNPVLPEILLDEAVRYMEPAINNAGQSIHLELPDKLPVILADEDRVRQVLFNLINNSVKYSYPGSSIRISAREEGKELIIEIQDAGRGMSEEEQGKLFQPYYRIVNKEHLSGLGLGLALSKQLIELQHGRIWVKSQKGIGTTFSFSLPIIGPDQLNNN